MVQGPPRSRPKLGLEVQQISFGESPVKDEGEERRGRASLQVTAWRADTCGRWAGAQVAEEGTCQQHFPASLRAKGPSASVTDSVAARAWPVAGPAGQQREVQAATLLTGAPSSTPVAA